MDRRVFGTLIACTLFTLVYFWMTPKEERPDAGDALPAGATANAGNSDSSRTPSAGAPNSSGFSSSSGAAGATGTGDVAGDSGDYLATDVGRLDIEPFENDDILVVPTNVGAGIEQLYLKRYFRTPDDRKIEDPGPEQWVALFPSPDHTTGTALGLREAGRNPRYGLDRANWAIGRDEIDGGLRVLEFVFETHDGLVFKKTLEFGQGYTIGVSVSVESQDESRSDRLTLLMRAAGGMADVERGQWTIEPSAVAEQINNYDEVRVESHTASSLAGEPFEMTSSGNWKVAWGGCSNLYFAALVSPADRDEITSVSLTSTNGDNPENVSADLVLPLPIPRGGEARTASFTYFVGPKDPGLMKRSGLSEFIPLVEQDYGSLKSFRWINKLLLAGLKFFEGIVGNYGVAIIILTLLMRVCMFPITRTQQVSMQRYSAKMQVLKPKLDELKEKYKNNTQKFAQEQMKLLREHGARPPVLGCLSSLITIPVFIGMFQILRSAIELRQAPFVLWIQDLSLPDALVKIPGIDIDLNVLPILATAAFLGQMMLAPKPADPQAQQQQKIMLFMPIVFGVMFYNYAAGLSLYMLTSSSYGMFEYRFIRQRFFPPPVVPATATVKAPVNAKAKAKVKAPAKAK